MVECQQTILPFGRIVCCVDNFIIKECFLVEIIQRIEVLLEEKGISGAKMSTDLGLGNSAYSKWRKGKHSISIENVIKIANYFNVSTDYLLLDDKKEMNCMRKTETGITDETRKYLNSQITLCMDSLNTYIRNYGNDKIRPVNELEIVCNEDNTEPLKMVITKEQAQEIIDKQENMTLVELCCLAALYDHTAGGLIDGTSLIRNEHLELLKFYNQLTTRSDKGSVIDYAEALVNKKNPYKGANKQA